MLTEANNEILFQTHVTDDHVL